jgi:uncharacterized protein (TIGR03435 family)
MEICGQSGGGKVETTSPAALPKLHYDVASIRETKREAGELPSRSNPAYEAKFDMEFLSLLSAVQLAYGLENYQIKGGPDWFRSKPFSIHARSDEAANEALKKLSRKDAAGVKREMLQKLLLERFHMKIRIATQQYPVFALSLSKGGSKLTAVESQSRVITVVRNSRGTRMSLRSASCQRIKVSCTRSSASAALPVMR